MHKTKTKVANKNISQGYNKVKLIKICIFVMLAFITNFDNITF